MEAIKYCKDHIIKLYGKHTEAESSPDWHGQRDCYSRVSAIHRPG